LYIIYNASFFKKLSKGANNCFNKVGHDSKRFSPKQSLILEDETLNGMKKAGNFIEKNAGLIGTGLAGAAMASGVGASIGAALMAGEIAGQKLGSDLKHGAGQIRRGVNQIADQTRIQGLNLQKQGNQAIKQNLQALSSNVGFAKQQAQQAINNAVNESKARANLALTSGADALTSAKFV